MKKRGQFYLIAAIIIIGIVLTSVTLINYIKTKKEKYPIYNLGDIVKFESAKVLDYGIVNGSDLNQLMTYWIINYTNYGGKSITGDWLFIYGEKNNLKALVINKESSGGITIDVGGTLVTSPQLENYIVKIYDISKEVTSEGKINISIPQMNYSNSFDVKPGQNFWFVITTGNQTVSNLNK